MQILKQAKYAYKYAKSRLGRQIKFINFNTFKLCRKIPKIIKKLVSYSQSQCFVDCHKLPLLANNAIIFHILRGKKSTNSLVRQSLAQMIIRKNNVLSANKR